jgi:hypothetical protein
VLVTAWPAPASAQNAEAEALFEDGNRLMQAGQLAQACDAFEASNRIEARAGTLIRLGECREQTHQLASAWSAYKDALARAKDEQKKAFAAARIAALEPVLSSLTIDVPAPARVDGLQVTRNGQLVLRASWSLAVPVDGGAYRVVASAPGRRDWTASVAVADASARLVVTVPELPPLADGGPATAASAWTRRRELAVGTAALAVAGVVTGGVLGVQSRDRERDAEALCTPGVPCIDGARAQALEDSAHSRAIGADVAFGLAGAAALATAALWLTGAPESRAVAVVPTITSGVASIAIHGRF